jgi:hypothetical protein
MNKTNTSIGVPYNKWSTTGWELLLLAIFNIVLTSCAKERLSGSGHVITETRETEVFTDVEVDGPIHIHLQQGPIAPVKITAEDNIMRVIDTYVSGKILHVRIKSGVRLHDVRDIDVYLTSATYNAVLFSGSGSVESMDTIRTDRFEYRIDGSGDARFNIITDKLETEINGSGSIRLYGTANTLRSTINGSGDIGGMDLYTEDADISVKGSGGHSLNVSHSLDVSIRGSGDVRYKGAASVTSDIQGSGKVIKL